MSPLRVVIADDEPVARQRLRRLLRLRDDCLVVGEFADGADLAASLPRLGSDVILLDIEMPGLDGFASVSRLAEPRPLVVFVTAYAEHAARAYDVDAVDYLLKPISSLRLDEALARTWRRLQAQPPAAVSRPAAAAPVHFMARGRTYLFDPATISTIEAVGNYIEITTETQRVRLRSTLAAAADRLASQGLVQVHRSWIVNRSAVTHITTLPGSRYEFLLTDGRRVPGGRAYSRSILDGVRSFPKRP